MIKIYCDLDSVLTNFEKGCQQVFNWPEKQVEPLSDIVSHLGITKLEFWDTIDSYGEEFWVNLEPEPWADELVDIIKYYDRDFVILTSPSRSHFAASGKVLWLQKFFKSKKFSNYIITPAKNKRMLANRRSILIDDNDRNCKEFRESLGFSIIFPRSYNSNWELEDQKLEHTKQQLNLIFKTNL
jgi:5'(3')-deoxyribonucleotidase